MTNFEAWSNCIGHSGEGGSSDLVETSSLGQMSWARDLALLVGLLDLSSGLETERAVRDDYMGRGNQ